MRGAVIAVCAVAIGAFYGGVALDAAIDADGGSLVGDSIRLQQVFTNVLSNAIKFTPKGGRISVAMSTSEGEARVAVRDTGAGLPPDLLPHVFEAFRQGHHTPPQASQGLGLGLAIARYLIEQHEGWMEAASDGPGCGSTLTVTLPLSDRPPDELWGPAPDRQADLRC
jgi:signal transduction histidine kinase